MAKIYSFEPKWVVVAIFFLGGIFVGSMGLYTWIYNADSFPGLKKFHPAKKFGYKYTNPLLAVDLLEKKEFFENLILENKLTALIDKQKKLGNIADIYLYFRDIEAGNWVGIKENNSFSVGKLFKIPVMISYLKSTETSPDLLAKTIEYSKDSAIFEESELIDGEDYTVDELIAAMVVNGDHSAAETLFDNIDNNSLNDVYSDLGMGFSEDKNVDDSITLKQYSLLFRILYNATYLSRANSEKALGFLTRTDSAKGMTAALPKEFAVAHIRGTRAQGTNGLEAHDCGIIYYPNHPYLLCVVAFGKKENNVQNIFRQIGKLVYDETAERYKLTN